MNIWIVFDDCPPDFGEKEIIRVFSSRRLAEYFLANIRVKKQYETQYYKIEKYKVHSAVTIG